MPHTTSATRRDLLKLAGGAASFAALGVLGASPARAAAPMLGVSRPSIYRFKLGSFEITNILDGYVQGNGPHPPSAATSRPKSFRLSPSPRACHRRSWSTPTSTRS